MQTKVDRMEVLMVFEMESLMEMSKVYLMGWYWDAMWVFEMDYWMEM